MVDFVSPVEAIVVDRMVSSIRHRGPDDCGVYARGPVGLGHARLSIIDLSPTGRQPMSTSDERYTIVFNGEVYNFPELRRRLEGCGVAFRGTSDTEVVLHTFAQWGPDAFSRFNGMFALAIWDEVTQRLTLARDRFGIKPLYYQTSARALLFGSEMKALLCSGRVERKMNWAALHEYLYYGYPIGANTFYQGIRELSPGSYATFDAAGLKETRYWHIEQTPVVNDALQPAARHVADLLDKAVQSHLISDVPVGVFLSGGVDSSAITALACRHYAGRLKTYSASFDFDKGVDERPKARLIAQRFGTEHHEVRVEGRRMPDVIEALVRCHDEPFGDAADIPLYLLCEQLRGSAKVILQGDGGDEIFAGYRRYNVLSFNPLWRTMSAFRGMLDLLPRGPLHQRATRFFRAIGHPDPALQMALYLTQEDFLNPPTRLFGADARQQLEVHDPFAAYHGAYNRLKNFDTVQRALYTDCLVLLPDMFLEKVDKSTMAHGIEVRVPFLDADLTDYALGLPSGIKVKYGQKKRILRMALRGIVPDEILDAPKEGFGVPYQYWLREPLAGYLRSVLLDDSIQQWGIFDRAALEGAIREHTTGQRNHGFLLWKLLNLGLWYRMYLHNNAPLDVPHSRTPNAVRA